MQLLLMVNLEVTSGTCVGNVLTCLHALPIVHFDHHKSFLLSN